MTAGDGVALACWPLSRFVVGAYKIPVAVAPWAASLPLSRPCVLAPRQITGLGRDWLLDTSSGISEAGAGAGTSGAGWRS